MPPPAPVILGAVDAEGQWGTRGGGGGGGVWTALKQNNRGATVLQGAYAWFISLELWRGRKGGNQPNLTGFGLLHVLVSLSPPSYPGANAWTCTRYLRGSCG
jgi:hypothetical protein